MSSQYPFPDVAHHYGYRNANVGPTTRPVGRNFQRGVRRLAKRGALTAGGPGGRSRPPEALGYLEQNPEI